MAEKNALAGSSDHCATYSGSERGNGAPEGQAYEALQKPVLDGKNREQLDMARRSADDQISRAYGKIEFSPLPKHFIITPEDGNGRARFAEQQRFRMILRSGTATPRMLLQAYEKFWLQVVSYKAPVPHMETHPTPRTAVDVAWTHSSLMMRSVMPLTKLHLPKTMRGE